MKKRMSFGLKLLRALLTAMMATVLSQHVASSQALPLASNDTFAQIVSGLGGETALLRLESFHIKSHRDRYLMGQGPEPGVGLFRGVTSEVEVSYDIPEGNLRLDFVHANHYRIKRDITELITGEGAYLMGWDDFYQEKPPGVNKAMKSDRRGASLKTERLLNPHLIIRDAIANPSLILPSGHNLNFDGQLLTADEVFPVSFSRDRASGKRVVVTNQQWLDRWSSTKFFREAIFDYEIDSQWLIRWQSLLERNSENTEAVFIDDPIYPMRLLVDSATGFIKSLTTMEHDVVLGDVPLEVSYFDWQNHQGVFFPKNIKISVADVPALDVSRSEIQINVDFDAPIFAAPAGVDYEYDQLLAYRGPRVSQLVQSLAHAGSPEKALGRPTIGAKEIEPGVFILDAMPSDVIYVMVVEQSNGVVVIEPGFFDLKGEAILDWITANIPDKPITHVVVTHAHMDHGGGVRPYVAAGAKLVVHSRAEAFYQSVLTRPASIVLPDMLDQSAAAPTILTLNDKSPFEILDDERPVVVYPVENGHSTDMVMVWLERERVLYSGDLYIGALARYPAAARKIPPATPPSSAIELYHAIGLYELDVQTLVGSHNANVVLMEEFNQFMGN